MGLEKVVKSFVVLFFIGVSLCFFCAEFGCVIFVRSVVV